MQGKTSPRDFAGLESIIMRNLAKKGVFFNSPPGTIGKVDYSKVDVRQGSDRQGVRIDSGNPRCGAS